MSKHKVVCVSEFWLLNYSNYALQLETAKMLTVTCTLQVNVKVSTSDEFFLYQDIQTQCQF